MSAFNGTWKMESMENMEKLFEKLGTDPAMSAKAAGARPTLTVTVNGDHYVFKHEEGTRTMTSEFDLGVEFESTFNDGRQYKAIVKKVGDKLVEEQNVRGKTITTERSVEGGTLITVAQCEGVQAIAKYKRIA